MSRIPTNDFKQVFREFTAGAIFVGTAVAALVVIHETPIDSQHLIFGAVLALLIVPLWLIGVAIHAIAGWYDV